MSRVVEMARRCVIRREGAEYGTVPALQLAVGDSGWFVMHRCLIFLCVLFLCISMAEGHPVSLSSAQVVVAANAADVRIRVMLEDLMMFQGLSPREDNTLSPKDLSEGAERHKSFLVQNLIVRNVDGERIAGNVTKMVIDKIPQQGVAMDKLMDHGVEYFLSYPLSEAPSHLFFQQVFGSGDISYPSVMELDIRQAGLKISDTVTLNNNGGGKTFEFDWAETNAAGEPVDEAWMRRKEKRKKERMGIESYDAIYGFIYIQDNEVRVELLIPLLTLETWLNIERKNPDFLEVKEQQAAKVSLEKFFRSKNSVKIDGIKVKPVLKRLDFYGLRFSDFAQRPDPRRIGALTARVGAILSYPAKSPPQKVEIQWEYFNAAVYTANTTVYSYDKSVRHPFSPYKPLFSWTVSTPHVLPEIENVNPGRRGRPLSDDEAESVVSVLLKNIYRAFDYSSESDIYDALEHSVHGELLAELYLKIYKGLVMQEQGGAVAHVKNVEIAKSTLSSSHKNRFTINLSWTVEGAVEHWGHIHTRINRYRAEFEVRVIDDAWKIDKMRVLEQKRVSYRISVR